MSRIRTVTAATVLVGGLVLAGCGSSGSGEGSTSSPSASATTASGSSSPNVSTTATPTAGPHNHADVMFASMMIPHHAQAIRMSDMLLSKTGIDPQVRDLATKIRAAQAPEIDQMSSWLTGWGANPSPSAMSGMDHSGDMGGMMSQHDMDALQKANGAQAQKLFLTGMIEHHQGAVDMAKTELQQGQSPEAKKLAQSIITTQDAEISQMKKLLGS